MKTIHTIPRAAVLSDHEEGRQDFLLSVVIVGIIVGLIVGALFL